MSLYEMVTGSRMHSVYARSGGVRMEYRSVLEKVYLYSIKYSSRIDAYEELLTTSRV